MDAQAQVDRGGGERRAARSIAADLELTLHEIAIDLTAFGYGTMTGIARSRLADEAGQPGQDEKIAPPEHWPYRNQALVTIAAMALAQERVATILIGTVAGDDEHNDGTSAFRETLSRLLMVQSGPKLEAPAAGSSIEAWLLNHPVPEEIMRWTFSCHVSEWACGACRGCAKHDQVMRAMYPRSETPS